MPLRTLPYPEIAEVVRGRFPAVPAAVLDPALRTYRDLLALAPQDFDLRRAIPGRSAPFSVRELFKWLRRVEAIVASPLSLPFHKLLSHAHSLLVCFSNGSLPPTPLESGDALMAPFRRRQWIKI